MSHRTTSKPSKAVPKPGIRLVVTWERGGKKDYVPTRERLEANHDGYMDYYTKERISGIVGHDHFESFSDLDDDDLDEIDPEGDMELFKTVGQVRLSLRCPRYLFTTMYLGA